MERGAHRIRSRWRAKQTSVPRHAPASAREGTRTRPRVPGRRSRLRSASLAEKDRVGVPLEVLPARVVFRPSRQPDRLADQRVVGLAVVEIGLESPAYTDTVVGRDGHVALVEEGVEVRTEEQAIVVNADDRCPGNAEVRCPLFTAVRVSWLRRRLPPPRGHRVRWRAWACGPAGQPSSSPAAGSYRP